MNRVQITSEPTLLGETASMFSIINTFVQSLQLPNDFLVNSLLRGYTQKNLVNTSPKGELSL